MPSARFLSVSLPAPCPLHPRGTAAAAATTTTAVTTAAPARAPRKRPGPPRGGPGSVSKSLPPTPPPPPPPPPPLPLPALSQLDDDLLQALAAHLDLPALHALLRASSAALRRRLLGLLPAVLRRGAIRGFGAADAAAAAAAAPAAQREAAMRALRAARPDPAQAAFALFAPAQLAPGVFGYLQPDGSHPLLLAYAEPRAGGARDVVSDPGHAANEASWGNARHAVIAVFARAFLAAGGTHDEALAPHLLAKCPDPTIVLSMIRWASTRRSFRRNPGACPAKPPHDANGDDAVSVAMQSLVVQLAHEKRAQLLADVLEVHPGLLRATAVRPGCANCRGSHGLLHAAAEVGCVDTVRSVISVAHIAAAQIDDEEAPRRSAAVDADLLALHDCNGESALGVAVRRRKSRVAQELMHCGADVEDLASCTARGGGGLSASEVWFKQALDVD